MPAKHGTTRYSPYQGVWDEPEGHAVIDDSFSTNGPLNVTIKTNNCSTPEKDLSTVVGYALTDALSTCF